MESTYVLLFLVNSEIELSYYWTIVAWKRSVLLASSRAGSRCSCGR